MIQSFRRTTLLPALLLAAAAALPGAAQAQLGTQLVASGLTLPLAATAPLNDGRTFIVERGGIIKVVQGGTVSNFLSIPVASGGERGLLGIAFDPGYADPASPGFRRFFVNYSDPTSLNNVIASYRTSAANPSLADPASRVEVIRIEQPNFSNHKAGWIGFKPGDANNLYIATGDGGSANDPGNRAQNKTLLLGKMLRIDINRDDFPSNPNLNYGIPANNPFVGEAGTRGEIFALGLRNPYRAGFDRLNGNLWIGDVGQNVREEIDFIAATSAGGQNFGWRQREGRIATPGISDPPTPGLIDPVLDYPRSFGASVIGGYVVREAGSPLFGRYVFGDFVNGRIFAIDGSGLAGDQFIENAWELTALLDAGAGGVIGAISSFGEGATGELFIVDYGGKVVVVVPEPGTMAMWALGLLGMGLWFFVRRRDGDDRDPRN